MADLADTFTRIYRENHWQSDESRSGVGSEMGRTTNIRARLPWLLEALNAQSLLDAGCGDLNWMQTVCWREPLIYVGVDIVPELVETLRRQHPRVHLETGDITRDRLPTCDVILCRTVLFHLPNADIARALANFARSGARYLLTTTYPWHFPNEDISAGGWRRLNLQAAPFNMPSPMALLPEDEVDPAAPLNPGYLGLWEIAG